MILTKPKNNKKKIAIIAAIAILVAVLLPVVYVYGLGGNIFGWTNQPKPQQASSFDKPATDEQKTAAEIQKEEAATSPSTDPKQSTPSQPDTPTKPNTLKTVDMNITAAAQNGSTLQIRVFVSTLSSQGKCTLTLEQPGRPSVTKTVGVQLQASASACDGFDIPVTEFATAGTWKATIVYADHTSTGTTSQNVTITK